MAQQLGVNLDPQSWSTFLTVAAGNGASPGAAAAAAAALGIGMPVAQHESPSNAAAAARVQQQQPAAHQIGQQAVVRNGSLQSQMLADLGLGSLPVNSLAAALSSVSGAAAGSLSGRCDVGCTSAAPCTVPHRQPSGSVSASLPDPIVSNTCSSASTSVSSSTGFVSTRASLNSAGASSPAAKSILWAAAGSGNYAGHTGHAMDPADAAASPLAAGRRSVDGSAADMAAAAAPASPGPTRAASPAAVPGPLHAGLLRPRSGQNVLHQVAAQQQQQSVQQVQHPSSPQHQSFLNSLQQQQQQLLQQQQQTASIEASSSQQPQRLDSQYSASPGVRFVQTPSGALRRKSVTELTPPHLQEQQAVSSTPDSPKGVHAPVVTGDPSRDSAAAGTVTVVAVLGSPGSQAGSAYRRTSEVGASGSPLAKLQSDQWGTLTAMSRGSGFGPGVSGFDSELSTDCHSAASWGSTGGAHSLAGTAAAAAAAGLSTPPGPGPSPLGVSSVGSAAAGTPESSAHTAATGSFSAGGVAAASVRRALHFTDGSAGSPTSSSGGSASSSAVSASGAAITASGSNGVIEATVDAARHRLSNNSRSNSITSQQQQLQQLRTPSKDGSNAMNQSQAGSAVASRPATVPQPALQHQQQYLQQLQQQHQALQQAIAQPVPVDQYAVSRPAIVPGAAAAQHAAARAADRNESAAVHSYRQPPASSTAISQQQQSVVQQPQQQPKDASPNKEQKRTVSDYGDDESAPAGSTAAPAGSQAAASTTAAAATPATSGSGDDNAMLLPGYSVSRVVGEGGFCQVRLATHHLSRRKVAVKVIDKTKLSDHNEASRIQREIRVLKRLNHPAIIRLFEVLEAGSKLFLVMEYAPSGSLLDYVRSRKRLSEGESAYFLQQIVAGLQYCHDNEVRVDTVVGLMPHLT